MDKKQKKALAKRTERKAKQKAARAVSTTSPTVGLVRHARSYPLVGCWTQRNWDRAGLAVVVVARRQPDGHIIFGTFLVDYYCLGVKDAYTRVNVPYSVFLHDALPHMIPGSDAIEITPALAHEIIYGGIEYAARFGFRPHPDFRTAQDVLDPLEQHPRSGTVTFGKDGKPFYISGPHDKPRMIVDQLVRAVGVGNFDYLVELDEMPQEWRDPAARLVALPPTSPVQENDAA